MASAHCFYEELCREIPVPILNALAQTAAYLRDAGIRTAGIMATDGTVRSGRFRRELEKAGIRAVVPSPRRQSDVMSLIYVVHSVRQQKRLVRLQALM